MQDQLQEAGATNLLDELLVKLQSVRRLDWKNPQFVSWRDTTSALFQRFLPPDSPHIITFQRLTFRAPVAARTLPYNYRGPRPVTNVSSADRARFESDCAMAEECIKAVREEIRAFGVHSMRDWPATRNGGASHQNFYGSVTIENQAIATGNSIQNIGQMGDTGTSLKEIGALLDQSMELTGREKLESFKALEAIVAETHEPVERRNWKYIFDCGEKLASIANKATDIATKLAPHMPALVMLMDEGRKRLTGG